jgi:phage internal scaffolding protein
VKLDNFEATRTKQAFKKDADINNIMAKYQKTGALTHYNRFSAQYGDATGIDFQNAMNLVQDVQEMFMELPSELKRRFNQDPEGFLDYVQNPDNAEEMAELGLRERRENDPVDGSAETVPPVRSQAAEAATPPAEPPAGPPE